MTTTAYKDRLGILSTLAKIYFSPAGEYVKEKNFYDENNIVIEEGFKGYDRNYVYLSEEEHTAKIKKIMSLFVNAIKEDVQEITIVEKEPITFKTKGIMTKIYDDEVTWLDDDFNFFLSTFTQQTVGGRQPVSSSWRLNRNEKKYILDQDKNVVPYHSVMDTNIFESAVDAYGKSFDFSVSLAKKTFRIHMFSTYYPESNDVRKEKYGFAIRIVPTKFMSYEELNLPMLFKGIEDLDTGLVLIAGHAGSGKTTTVATIVNEINIDTEKRRVILIIEDPPEYSHRNAQSVVIQRAVGMDKNVPSYERAIKDSLRQNVDTVVIGEASVAEEFDAAIRAAETGKKVILTVHSNSVADTIDRIVNTFPGDLQDNVRARLSEVVVSIVHQRLETIETKETVRDEKTTVEEVKTKYTQIPVASGFLITNLEQKNKFRESIDSREKMQNLVTNEGKHWAISHRESYDELVERGIVEDTEENRRKLVPKI